MSSYHKTVYGVTGSVMTFFFEKTSVRL